MAWPFSSVLAPNLSTGNTTVPTSSTSLTTSVAWLLGANFANTSGVLRTVTITDTANNAIVSAMEVVPGVPASIDWAFLPTTGVKWSASGSGVTGNLWGYV